MEQLDDEDIGFMKRFLLASGSLKELAKSYGVSYPTVRLRVDRLIQKVEILDDTNSGDDHERMLRSLAAEGRFDTATLKALLQSYRETTPEKSPTETEIEPNSGKS
ncbi:MAG: DUF2089 family protein [Verrucomicrobiales bacterium]|nr:DUF2089 family protein [Verrucomicrobiales bacterium]